MMEAIFFPDRPLPSPVSPGRNSDAEELHDNRRVDVRGDRQSEQSTVVERVTGHHYQVVQEGAAVLNKIAALNEDVCERNRNSGADSEDKNNQSGEEESSF